MTLLVLFTTAIILLLALSIHLGLLHSMEILMPRLHRLDRNRVGGLILAAIVVHLLEIGVFAIGLGILRSSGTHGQLSGAYEPGFASDLYFSAVTYTGLGYGDINPTGALRFFSAIEAIAGLLLIAWSASAIFLAMRQYWWKDVQTERHQ